VFGVNEEVDVARAAGRPRPAFVISATRRAMAQREVAELGSKHVDAATGSPEETSAS
jgi:hypothetical protein